jgi:hypothetical protein
VFGTGLVSSPPKVIVDTPAFAQRRSRLPGDAR